MFKEVIFVIFLVGFVTVLFGATVGTPFSTVHIKMGQSINVANVINSTNR